MNKKEAIEYLAEKGEIESISVVKQGKIVDRGLFTKEEMDFYSEEKRSQIKEVMKKGKIYEKKGKIYGDPCVILND